MTAEKEECAGAGRRYVRLRAGGLAAGWARRVRRRGEYDRCGEDGEWGEWANQSALRVAPVRPDAM
jgi:hypothetical protein